MFKTPPDFTPLCTHPDFLAFRKPPGLETISQDGAADFTSGARAALDEPGLVPVHRLDRDTSGVQLLARTPAGERGLTALFRERRVDKTYLALSLGAPRNATGTVNRNLSEWSGGRRPVRVLRQGGLQASTRYQVVARGGAGDGLPVGLVAFMPHQGRTHQIRVHAAALGCPILGDDQYGDRPANRLAKERLGIGRQMLHCWRLIFPWNGSDTEILAEPFPDFASALGVVFPQGVSFPDSDTGAKKR